MPSSFWETQFDRLDETKIRESINAFDGDQSGHLEENYK